MSLVRSPATGHESARRFYSAFYLWSRLISPQSHVKSSRPKHTYPKRASRSLSTTAAPNTATTTTPSAHPKETITLLLKDADHSILTRSKNARLKIIAAETGAQFDLENSDKFPADGLHRLSLHGSPNAIFDFSRRVIEASSGNARDGGAVETRESSVPRRPGSADTVLTPRVNIPKVDTPKVDTPVVSAGVSDGVATKHISHGASEEVVTIDTSAGASSQILTPDTLAKAPPKIVTSDPSIEASPNTVTPDTSVGAPVISATDKHPLKYRTARLTPLEQINVHILTESLLDAIKAESGVHHLSISTQDDILGRPVIRLAGSKSARTLATKSVRDALNKAASTPILGYFRQAMRSVPSSVAVLTAALRTGNDKKASFRGMTVSSFTAVSLSPDPIISLNIRTPSRTLHALDCNPKFHLHIPAANILGKTIADAFTKPHADPSETFRDLSAKGVQINERHGLPSIHGPGIQVRYLCHIIKDKTVIIGDHVVLFATVKHVWMANLDSSAKHPPAGLAYVHGKYSRASELVDHDSKEALKLTDDEYTPMLTPEQIMAQIVDPILNSKSEQHVSESNGSVARKGPPLKPSRDSEAKEQRSEDMNERYFTFAEEYEADDHTEDVDTERPDETSSSSPTNTHVGAKYTTNASTSATIPTGTHHFSTFQRPATTTTTLGLSSTRRTISTSTTTPPSSTSTSTATTDPAILSQTVETYIYQPFDPETKIYKRNLRNFHIRIGQRQTLDKCTRRLQLAYENDEIDEEALLVLGDKVDRLKGQLMRFEMDLAEFENYVVQLEEALDNVGEVRASETEEGSEVVNEQGYEEEGTEEQIEEGVEEEGFEASNETREERRTEISEEGTEEGSEKKYLGTEFEEMMERRQD